MVDSELTSIALSSPSPSPPRRPPVYYVQPPSSGTLRNPAAGSPPHSYNYAAGYYHNSQDSLSTIPFSGLSLPPRRSSRDDEPGGAGFYAGEKAWIEGMDIEEERLLEELEEDRRRGTSCRCCVLSSAVIFLLAFFMVALILWGKSHRQSPIITMKSIKFENFDIQAGTDDSMVPTDLGTLNSTIKFTYRNTGRFFGVHVTSTPVHLYYYQSIMASGYIDYFYQSKRTERNFSMMVVGDQVPLYGGGYGLSSKSTAPVNLTLNFTMSSRAYVLGKLVEPNFHNSVQCLVAMDPTQLDKAISLRDSCQYH